MNQEEGRGRRQGPFFFILRPSSFILPTTAPLARKIRAVILQKLGIWIVTTIPFQPRVDDRARSEPQGWLALGFGR
jgi:hypothetical protein